MTPSPIDLVDIYGTIGYNSPMSRVAIKNKHGISILDNVNLELQPLAANRCPQFLEERFALVSLMPVNKSGNPDSIGRRFSENVLVAYLNADEYLEVQNVNAGKQGKGESKDHTEGS
jgi:hypothetical protein